MNWWFIVGLLAAGAGGVFLGLFIGASQELDDDDEWREVCDVMACGQPSEAVFDVRTADGLLYLCGHHAPQLRRWALRAVKDGDVG